MTYAKLLLISLVLSLNAATADAVPILYGLRFTVASGNVGTANDSHSGVGNVYGGIFGVDSAVLLSDGNNKAGDVLFMSIQMEDNIWAYNAPSNNSFVGFRGPTPGCSACMAPSPGFDVLNGAIANLRGGVFGSSDAPFIDFSAGGPHRFSAFGVAEFPGASWVQGVQGQMDVFRIPEPGALTLCLVAFALVATARRRARTALAR